MKWVTITALIVLSALFTYHSLQDYYTSSDLAHTADVTSANHTLICQLDELFGLDRRLPRAQMRRLRPSQRMALLQIIAACPELRLKGTR